MRAVGLSSLALLAKSHLTIALDSERCDFSSALAVCGEDTVSVIVRCRSRVGENGCCVGPIKENIERNTNR